MSVWRPPLAMRVDVLLVAAARESKFGFGATSSRMATVSALEATRRAVIPRRFEPAEDLS